MNRTDVSPDPPSAHNLAGKTGHSQKNKWVNESDVTNYKPKVRQGQQTCFVQSKQLFQKYSFTTIKIWNFYIKKGGHSTL